MILTHDEFDTLAWTAFRYALGRQTYVVGQVVSVLVAHAGQMDAPTRRLIAREIREAFERGGISDIDRPEWERLREAMDRHPDGCDACDTATALGSACGLVHTCLTREPGR